MSELIIDEAAHNELRQKHQILSLYLKHQEERYLEVHRQNINHALNIDLLNAELGRLRELVATQEEIIKLASETAAEKDDKINQLQRELAACITKSDP